MTSTFADFRPLRPYEAQVLTPAGPLRAQVLGLLGDCAVVRWSVGPRAGSLSWPSTTLVTPPP